MTCLHRLRFACSVLALLASGQPAHAGPDDATLDAINAVRAGSVCTSGQNWPPLLANPQLDAAALELSRNPANASRPLNDLLQIAGYRASRSMALQVGGVAPGAALARFVEQRYCDQIVSSDWQEIGIHQRHVGTQAQAWLVLARPLSAPPADRAAEIGARVLELVNIARGEARVCGDKRFAAAPPVTWNSALARTSALHARDMASHSYFSHDSRDGSKPADRASRAGYVWRAVGENIAAGQATAEEAVRGWIDSPPHCANLMSPRYTEMGVAYAVNMDSKMAVYWVQVFGTPR